MKFLGFMIAGLMLPLGAWADYICTAYQFTCAPDTEIFETRVIALDECNHYSEPFYDDNERKIQELAKQNIYPLIPGTNLLTHTCELDGHTFEVKAHAIDNYELYSAGGGQCSGQGPSLSLSVKKDGNALIQDVEFVNGCWEEYKIREMRYIAVDRFIKNSGATLKFKALRSDPVFLENGDTIHVNMEAYFKMKNVPKGVFTQELLNEVLDKITDRLKDLD